MHLQQEKGGNVTSFLAVFLLSALRFLYFGFRYFPQLDDYIQYHNYAAQGSFGYLLNDLGLFGARPLAGLMDVTLWSWLWEVEIVGVIILCALFAATAVIFKNLFSRLFGTGTFFLVIFALMPLGIEGTYWMSAATRIVVGMFFAALSADRFYKYLICGKIKFFCFSLIFQFLTFCLYEQAAVLSCALNILVALLFIREENRRWILSFSCIAVAVLYFAICAMLGPSALYDGRTSVILPFSAYYWKALLPDLISQFKSAFLGGGYYLLVYGFIRGVMRIISDGAWIYIFALLLLCAFFVFATREKKTLSREKYLSPLWFGALIALAPLLPFFIIENPYFSLRGTVTSFAGIALVSDLIVRRVLGARKTAIRILGAVFAFIFCICSASEIGDYRSNYNADIKIVSAVSEIAEDFPEGGKVAVLNLNESYVSELNCKYHEHIKGVTESSWALTGAVRCYNDNPDEFITYVPISLKDEVVYKKWEYDDKTISSMDGIYFYDDKANSVERLSVKYGGDNSFTICNADGTVFGRIVEEDRIGHFFEE